MSLTSLVSLTVALAAIASVTAQDPAPGWMAYAVGAMPSTYSRITKLQMTWTVGESPRPSQAFFSPWFGMDPADNLNLIQPVNPWGGGSWSMYTEYFQWRPEHNSNSDQYQVKSGQTLVGTLEYNGFSDSYILSQHIVETGEYSNQTVKCQFGKKYTVPYIVYEKTFPCKDYPPDEKVTFRDIKVECDGIDCTQLIRWTPQVKDPNCDMKANIISPTEISITWNTELPSKYDNYTIEELYAKNYHGWATKAVPALEIMIEQ